MVKNIGTLMEQDNFKQECHRQLLEHFNLVKKQKVDDAMKHRIQGFINAGEFLNIVTREQAIQIIDIAHLEVFGVTKEQRKAHKDIVKAVINGKDNSVFDIPAINRRSFTGL
jgi:HD-GYP domain-containing protein (c-di-GMP phosphodiesterase class II)